MKTTAPQTIPRVWGVHARPAGDFAVQRLDRTTGRKLRFGLYATAELAESTAHLLNERTARLKTITQ